MADPKDRPPTKPVDDDDEPDSVDVLMVEHGGSLGYLYRRLDGDEGKPYDSTGPF